MKFDEDKITALSSELLTSVERLRELSSLSREAFLRDPFKLGAAKYFLVVSIEAAIDMCNHVISQNRMRAPSDYADSFMVLGEAGALERDFVNRLTTMVKFRNRLVHIYWEVDEEQIWEIITKDIGDIEEFHRRFIEFLKAD